MTLKKIRGWWENLINSDFLADSGIRKLLWGILFFLLITLILTIDLIPNQINLKVGQVSNTDIVAPKTTTFINQEKTQQLKNMAAQSAPKVYEENTNVNNEIKKKINTLFSAARDIRNPDNKVEQRNETSDNKTNITKDSDLEENTQNSNTNEESDQDIANTKQSNNELKSIDIRIETLKQRVDINLNESTYEILVSGDNQKINNLKNNVLTAMDKQLKERILPEDLKTVKDTFTEIAKNTSSLPGDYRVAMADVLKSVVKPNMILNKEATQQRQEEAMNQVEPVKRTVRQGEIIVRKGDVVTEEDIEVLKALGLQKAQVNYFHITGVILISLLLIVTAGYYLRNYKEKIWNNNNKLVLIGLLTLIIVLLAKIFSVFQLTYLTYLVPVAAVSVLITVLLDSETSIVITIFISFFVALVFNGEFEPVIISFIGGLVGVFSVSRVSQRSDLVRAGFYVSGVLAFLVFSINLLNPSIDWLFMIQTVSMGIMNGVLVAILANGLLPYLENGFGLTSAVKLLELSNPSQPLLKRLLVEAPGTYHHSVIVGNLAEAAADNIEGADSLLARVGAYYHDIGKLKRPYFFTDNQFGGENPHDKISANLSALIIKSHVKDGVELAKKYKLPGVIIDIIKQHQGTNLISYFYQQAIKNSKHDEIEENDFRYDGPKPQSKEAAIIMLADIVEATVRSKQFNKNNHNRIESLVRGLIREKLTENQLDECDLSLKDLDIIAESFVKVLTGIYHQRVEYPDNLLQEVKRADKSDKD